MIKDRDINFKEHSVFLSEIAQDVLDGNDEILLIPGVREIIALYLMIPHATHSQLETGMSSVMPKLDISKEFINGVILRDLRDTICHSFVTVEESTEGKLGRIVVDDRAQMNRKKHDEQKVKTKGIFMEIKPIHDKLKKLHVEIINSIK